MVGLRGMLLHIHNIPLLPTPEPAAGVLSSCQIDVSSLNVIMKFALEFTPS